MTERKLAMERTAKTTEAKLPKLRIIDHSRLGDITILRTLYGYSLVMAFGKVRDKISNLKPGSVGYKIAWEQLKKEYGNTRLVVNTHVDEIINLPPDRGSSYERVEAFCESLSRNYSVPRLKDP